MNKGKLPNLPAENWHLLDIEEVLTRLKTEKTGLDREKAAQRFIQYGANELKIKGQSNTFSILIRQFTDFMILVLFGAAVISGIIGDITDTLIILAIIILNAAIGFFQEYKAGQAMNALKKMAAPNANILCNGQINTISASDLVPGDLVLLEAGNIVPADLRLIETVMLKVDESTLTGESVSVEKHTLPIVEAIINTADFLNMAFKGTVVTTGTGLGVVTATGMNTEFGKIARMLQTDTVKTPLQKRLALFSRRLAFAFFIICGIVFFTGIFKGEKPVLMLLTAISLAVAAIPEALPAMVTISLSLGAKRMAKNNALIRKLPAVETLGSVTYICTDKTGTLTFNKMSVKSGLIGAKQYTDQDLECVKNLPDAKMLLIAAALNNDVSKNEAKEIIGDPTEIALFDFAQTNGYFKNELLKSYPEILHFPFEAVRKCMTTIHRLPDNEGFISFTKGAVDVLLDFSTNLNAEEKAAKEESVNQLSSNGYRVIGFSMKTMKELPQNPVVETFEQDTTFLGALGMIDPIRPEAAKAIEICNKAGIKTVMITGDHPATARYIAKKLGILQSKNDLILTGAELLSLPDEELSAKAEQVRVYARVNPEQKYNIIQLLQSKGQVVAMTGDGVNDAPALKNADIGVAMAITGSDVSKEAANMILLDDNFATIVRAVKEGRRIYDNIRKFVKFIMSGNSAEIFTILIAPLLGLPIPLLPIHILWINLVTDGLPSLALAAETSEDDVMNRKPKKVQEGFFADGVGLQIVINGLFIGIVTLGIQYWSVYLQNPNWQTLVFTTLCFCQLALALAIRSNRKSLFSKSLFSNKFLLFTILATVLIQLCLIYIPFLNSVFKTAPLTLIELSVAFGAGMLVIFMVETGKLIDRFRYKHPEFKR
ncbi:MAG: cation-translocating P-type ATPase [Sphingobacteriales bacterium]|nr:MAG: cation-translocating P-type ATPase [Sphingobacteriales bacterium]